LAKHTDNFDKKLKIIAYLVNILCTNIMYFRTTVKCKLVHMYMVNVPYVNYVDCMIICRHIHCEPPKGGSTFVIITFENLDRCL